MQRNYEFAFLIREGDPVKDAKKRIHEYLTHLKAKIAGDNDMGTRDLAYMIVKNREKFKKAFYYFVNAELDTLSLPEFETKLKYDTDVIRYMVILEK